MRKFDGYRGTTLNNGEKNTLKQKLSFSTGEDEWLGYGIYFFENDKQEAYNFAKFTRKINSEDICVIYALIKVSEDKIFDLLKNEDYIEYIKAVKTIAKRYKEEEEVPVLESPVDCGLINDICEDEGFLLVRGAFNPKHKNGIELKEDNFTRVTKTHIQLCVKDKSVIKKCELLDN